MSNMTGAERNAHAIRYLEGLLAESAGAAPDCEGCGTECICSPCPQCEDEDSGEGPPPACKCLNHSTALCPGLHAYSRGHADEGNFSWSPCELCGSRLGGNRYPAHGLMPKPETPKSPAGSAVLHLDVCIDCIQWLANGVPYPDEE